MDSLQFRAEALDAELLSARASHLRHAIGVQEHDVAGEQAKGGLPRTRSDIAAAAHPGAWRFDDLGPAFAGAVDDDFLVGAGKHHVASSVVAEDRERGVIVA